MIHLDILRLGRQGGHVPPPTGKWCPPARGHTFERFFGKQIFGCLSLNREMAAGLNMEAFVDMFKAKARRMELYMCHCIFPPV